MYWIVLKRAILDLFESESGSKEEFAGYLHWEVTKLDELMDRDEAPNYDVGRELERLLRNSISFRVSRLGRDGLRPGCYRVYPQPGLTGPVVSMRVSENGEIEFRPNIDIGIDSFEGYMVQRNLEAELASIG
ncbi:hypothetical protein LOC68_07655 [Blastopirellula sp. JC732]|uniref:Uncharacterized protein n=1 Tax=Blastopirellula sediminis TaxID=2894196 RepID=A0A9X1MK62_9BACT|nr:hypothetical protein [Blastopirellula sediminis]MCC9608957.1 hypothetical protein [Blastopirellula sediminis]MCC9628266.1 hypothetical protein [Blastopirellula sediminis]